MDLILLLIHSRPPESGSTHFESTLSLTGQKAVSTLDFPAVEFESRTSTWVNANHLADPFTLELLLFIVSLC